MVWRAVQQSTHQILMMTWRERQDLVSDPLVRELLQKAMDAEFLKSLDEEEWDFRPSRNHRKMSRRRGKLRTLRAICVESVDPTARGVFKVKGDPIGNTEDVDEGEILLISPVDQMKQRPPSTMKAMAGGLKNAKRKAGRPDIEKRWALIIREEGSEARVFSEVRREHVLYDFRVIMETDHWPDIYEWCERHFSNEGEDRDEHCVKSGEDRAETRLGTEESGG